MGVALTLQQYLDDQDIEYDVMTHKKTGSSSGTAEASQIPGARLAKGVVVKQKKGYLLVVLPTSRLLNLKELAGWLKQPVVLATEEELSALFPDCDTGAVPPIGAAYGLKAVVDESLERQEDIYF